MFIGGFLRSLRIRKSSLATLLVAIAVFLMCIFMVRHRAYQPPVIRGDGQGYHLWVRGFLTGDIRFCNFKDLVPGYVFVHEDPDRAVCQLKYAPGVGLLSLPVMAVVLRGHYAAPVLLPVEHFAVLGTSSFLLVVVCLLIGMTCIRLGADETSATIAILSFVFGTGLFIYSTYWASYSHIYAAFAISLLIWAMARKQSPITNKQPSNPARGGGKAGASDRRATIVVGLAAFLLVLIRNVDVLALVIVAGIYAIGFRQRYSRTKIAKDLAPIALGAIPAGMLQLAYNWYAGGHPELSSYGKEWFQIAWSQPLKIAVSYDRGLLPTYPVVAVAILLGLVVRRTRLATIGFLILLSTYFIIYGFWDMPGLGWSFGPRGLVDFMPLSAVLFALALSGAGKFARRAGMMAALICTVITVELAIAQVTTRLAPEGITSTMYWDAVSARDMLRHLSRE
jgi:hypothetical protein